MPSTSAMSWVVAPWKPRSAKTRAAASMISGARRRGLGRERREEGRGTTAMASTFSATRKGFLQHCLVPRQRVKFYLLSYRQTPKRLGGPPCDAQISRRPGPRGRLHRALRDGGDSAHASARARRIRFFARYHERHREDHAAGAIDHALLALFRLRRSRRLCRCRS